MIIKCSIDDEQKVFSYIGDNYTSCLYMYLDLKKYGLNSELIDLFFQLDDNEITCVLLKYYSCIHVYSTDNCFNAKEIGSFIADNEFSIIYCTRATAEIIYDELPSDLKEKSNVTNGWVSQIYEIDSLSKHLAVKANESDFDQIAELIYEDEDIGKSYKYNDLKKQLRERNLEGYTRNYVIKNGDLVIAHACTNAEIDDIAVVAELLVRKEFRKRGFASEIWRDICGKLLSENKKVYSFYYSDESRLLHKRIGFKEICEWTKIVINTL